MVSRWPNARVLAAMSRSVQVAELRAATVHDETAAAMAVVWLAESIRVWLRRQDTDDDAEQVQEALDGLRAAAEQLDPDALQEAAQALAGALEATEDGGRGIEGLEEAARDASIELRS